MFLYQLPRISDARMSCCWGIVEGMEDFPTYCRVIIYEGFVDCIRGGGKKMIGKQSAWQIRIHPLVKVFPAGEKVGDSVGSPGNVLQCVVEILEEFDPTSLPASHLLWFPEVLQVFVIGEHPDRVLCT